MRKIITTFILAVLIILPICAVFASDFDGSNYKVFDKDASSYGKITIYDTEQISDDKRVAEYILLKNTDQCLIDCYAEGTVQLFSDGRIFDKLEFKDAEGINTELSKSQVYIHTTETYYEREVDYEK